MFSGLKRFIGYVGVDESETHITIEGLPGYDLARDIQQKWQTSKVNGYLFSHVGKSKIIFPKFFAIDVLYIFRELYADPKTRTAKRLLEKIINELYNKTWLKDISLDEKHTRLNFSRLSRIKLKMLDHQIEFLENYNQVVPSYRLRGLLLAAAPGSGKTLTCIAVSECVEADVFIAVVPKNALERVWEKTFAELINDDPQYWVSKTLGEAAPLGKEYYAFHYEALDRAVEFAKKLKPGTKVCIALDECHNFNEINSARTQLFITLCKLTQSEDIIWSSGTPVKAIGAECVPLLQTIDPFFDNLDAQTRFKKIFGKDAKKANDILRNRIGIVSFKINKKEVVKGEVITQRVDVKIPNGTNYTLDHIRGEMRAFIDERTKFYNERMGEITDLYNECVKHHEATLKSPQEKEALETYRRYIKMIRTGYDPVMMKAEVIYCNKYELQKIIPSLPDFQRKEFKSARSVVKYVSLKIMGEALGGVLGKRRSQCHVDMVEHVNLDQLIDSATKKSIVFTSYVDVVDKSSDWLEERGYQPLKIYGDTNKNLANLIKRFEKEEDLNPVIATYQSLSTAVPLTMANNLVMMNAPFRDHEREQAISRCDRLGQDSTVTVYDVFLDTGAAPNISTRSKEILDWSKQQVESIMGIHAPTDLNATLESMVNAGDSFVVSQEAFVSECIRLVKH